MYRILAPVIFFISTSVYAQIYEGVVRDRNTNEPLPYVHIGVPGKNVGTISHDDGSFSFDLAQLAQGDSLGFSMIGYKTRFLSLSEIDLTEQTMYLKPIAYELREVVVKAKEFRKRDLKKFGRPTTTKTTTGQTGIREFGWGGEWGLMIKPEGKTILVQDLRFHTMYNTMDSILYRIHVYEVENGMPGRPLLQNNVFVTSRKKDKWITADLASENLVIEEDIIATFEIIRIFYSEKGDNQLFFTHGKGYKKGRTFSRNSSFDQWEVDKRPPVTMYVSGILID